MSRPLSSFLGVMSKENPFLAVVSEHDSSDHLLLFLALKLTLTSGSCPCALEDRFLYVER